MQHEIQLWPGSRDLLIWDDAEGTVTLPGSGGGDLRFPGDEMSLPTVSVDREEVHDYPWNVCRVFQNLEPDGVVRFAGVEEQYTLRNVRHAAADFLRLMFPTVRPHPSQLPESLREIAPTPPDNADDRSRLAG